MLQSSFTVIFLASLLFLVLRHKQRRQSGYFSVGSAGGCFHFLHGFYAEVDEVFALLGCGNTDATCFIMHDLRSPGAKRQ